MLNDQNNKIQVKTDSDLIETRHCQYGFDCSTTHDWLKVTPTRNVRKNILTYVFV